MGTMSVAVGFMPSVFSYQIRIRLFAFSLSEELKRFATTRPQHELHRQLASCLTIIGALKTMFALMGYTNASIHSFPFPFHERSW